MEAICADPVLARRLVLKGGSAIEMIYGMNARTSIDLDFSIEGDFSPPELPDVEARITRVLEARCDRLGIRVFDLVLAPRPPEVSADLAHFWGGYRVRFKLIPSATADRLGSDIEALRRNAIAVGPAQRKTFDIDISRHEICPESQAHPLGEVTVLAYSPRLIVAEKLRAICQQHPEYRRTVRSPGGQPRSRDFFDIHHLIDGFSLVLTTRDFLDLVERVFRAKHVPMPLLWRMSESREFHRTDFQALLDTVAPGASVLTFDEYFDYTIALVGRLEALRNE